jgi:hypothetical protein
LLFEISNPSTIEVAPGEIYAIVVELVSRSTNNDALPIALALGLAGDGYSEGDGYIGESNVGFTQSRKDYLFVTYVRLPE